MEQTALIDTALSLATEAHAGLTRWNGDPYVTHPQRVAASVAPIGPAAIAAALLHDVVEDTSVTIQHLRALGFPPAVIEAVDALTKRPGEDYFRFIDRVSAYPLARSIKLADIADNLSDLDAGPRRDKYLKASSMLLH